MIGIMTVFRIGGFNLKFPNKYFAVRIALLYLLFSVLWILFSDRIVLGFSDDPIMITRMQSYKGWFFVLLSAGLIFLLVRHEIIRLGQIHQVLKQNQERFNSIVDNLLEGGQLIGFDWRYLYLNDVAEIHNRRPNAELLGNRVMDMWPGIENNPVFPAEKACMELRIPQQLENEFVFPDGHSGWFDLRIVPVPEGIFILSIDISKRKYAEVEILATSRQLLESKLHLEDAYRDLEKKESNYRELFMNNPQPMWVYDTETLQFLMVNDAAIHHYGYKWGEYKEMTLKDIRPDEDVEPLLQNLKDQNEEYQQSGPWRHKKKNGEIILVDITSHGFVYQGRDARFVMAQDITERLNAEKELRLQSAALNSAANAILITDEKGKIVWGNPAFEQLTGYILSEVTGKRPGDLLNSGFQNQAFYENLWTTIINQRVWRGEIVNRKKDGSIYIEEQSITPVVDPSGQITHFVSIRQDITERKQSEKKLYESEERLRLALAAANQGLYDLNVQTGAIIVNDNYAAMLGYDPSAFVETIDSWLGRLHPDDVDLANKAYTAFINGEVPEYRLEFRLKMADGEWKWLLSVGRIIENDQHNQPLRMLGTHTDITETKNNALEIASLLEASERRLARISALRNIDTAISAYPELGRTFNIIINQVVSHLMVDACAILLFSPAEQEFYFAGGQGFITQRIKNSRIKLGESQAGRAAVDHKMLHIADIDEEDIDAHFRALMHEENIKTYFGQPLYAKGKLIGVLELFHRSHLNPDQEWLDFYQTLAGQAGIAIENIQLFENLQVSNKELMQAYDATIVGWSKALDLRDEETENHTKRVVELTVKLCQKLGFSEEELVHITRGAILHDIGKMGVPDKILLKPGKLTDEEWVAMRKHPLHAYDMLYPIEYLRPAMDIPHLHHERWDGSGYPLGLKGEQIPLAARIFAIIDVYDALTSDRPYRGAWTDKATRAYLLENGGVLFDPKLVPIFLDYLTQEKPE
ncbi:MAG: hypothetical protein CVU39_25600 [Chloroflexi bacterium HGW-Chloroflexi-10]|nr:MAG: hypothetical protein CVU39_25600 [Chloroflexi bacterium HGW-Chloroflexi-10]